MKRTLSLFLLVASIATSTTTISAQKAKKPFSGTITYSLTYDGVEATQQAQMPKSTTKMISGNKQKTTLDLGQYAYITITNGDQEFFLMFMDIMGQKYGYRIEKADIDKKKAEDKSPKPAVTLSDETKEIAGVKCKKATSVYKDEETGDVSTTTIWYTEELGLNEKLDFLNEYEGVKGIILGTESSSGKVTQKSYASEIKKSKVKDTEFLVPADATIYKSEEEFSNEMKAKFGGGGEEE